MTLAAKQLTNFGKREIFLTALLFFLLAYLVPIAFRPMIRPDEFRYAEVPREMLVSDNWVSPRLAGMRYFEKPALGYQLTAISFQLFGQNAFALRLIPVLATGLTALLLALFMRRERETGGITAIIFLSFAMVWGIGTFAVTDALLNFFITSAILAIFAAERSGKFKQELPLLIIAGVAAGCGALVKGLPGIAVPALVGGSYLIWQKSWKKIVCYLPIIGAVTILVILPWGVLIHQQEPDFWHYFLIEEHWHRYTGSTYDRKPQPWWFFIPFLVGGVLPAGIGFLLKKIPLSAFTPAVPRRRLLLLWAVLPFLLFSAGSCKLGTYILPCFPALAGLLASLYFGDGRELPSRCSGELSSRVAGIFLLGIGAAAAVVFFIQPHIEILAALSLKYFPLYLAIAAAGAGILSLRMSRSGGWRQIQIFLLIFTVLVNTVCLLMPTEVYREKATAERIKECLNNIKLTGDEVIFADKNLIVPLSWTLKKTDIAILGRPGELEYAAKNYPQEYHGRFCPLRDFAGHPALRGKKTVAVFYLAKKGRKLPAGMPAPDLSVQSGKVTLIMYRRK